MCDSVWHDLVRTLRTYRGGHRPRRMARHVCRHADGTIALVGLTANARRALFFDRRFEVAYTLPVTRGGVHAVGIAPPGPSELVWQHPEWGPNAAIPGPGPGESRRFEC